MIKEIFNIVSTFTHLEELTIDFNIYDCDNFEELMINLKMLKVLSLRVQVINLKRIIEYFSINNHNIEELKLTFKSVKAD